MESESIQFMGIDSHELNRFHSLFFENSRTEFVNCELNSTERELNRFPRTESIQFAGINSVHGNRFQGSGVIAVKIDLNISRYC